ncbi:MAG: HAD family phosphatase [Erysipelotrichaceae bacterium]|nr:HAD family phosphatase [Erysipelotrichaceae bacterium]
MNIKMIVTDMDGTLLNNRDECSAATCAALIKAQEKGMRLVLASGRSYTKMLKYADMLHMREFGGYLIEVNGMALMDLKTSKRTVYQQLNQQDCQRLFDALAPYVVEQIYMIDDGMYHYLPQPIYEKKVAYRKQHGYPDDYPLTASILGYLYDNREGYPRLMTMQTPKDIKLPINKLCVYEEPNKLKPIADDIKATFQQDYWAGLVHNNWLEITQLGVSKAVRLKQLADQLHIKSDEILCFGDGENDIEMLQSVTYGIAMGNALDNVKQAAFDVTLSNDEDGIWAALKQYEII